MKKISIKTNRQVKQSKEQIEEVLNYYFSNDIILTGQIRPLKFAMYSKSQGKLISDYMTLKELFYFTSGVTLTITDN